LDRLVGHFRNHLVVHPMTIKIPLPWYSKSVYDAPMDEVRGGWRYFAIRLRFERLKWPSGVGAKLEWALGAWFV
jgi:hypothetical protein